MNDQTRLTLACVIVGLLVLVGVPSLILYRRQRKRKKLRRRGIKRYGH